MITLKLGSFGRILSALSDFFRWINVLDAPNEREGYHDGFINRTGGFSLGVNARTRRAESEIISPPSITLNYSSGEIGDVNNLTSEILFTTDVNSPTNDYLSGVTIKVNAVTVTINDATRQGNAALVYYDHAVDVDINDVITWEYDDDFGDLEDNDNAPLGDIAAKTLTNYIGSHLYFDEEWDSYWAIS